LALEDRIVAQQVLSEETRQDLLRRLRRIEGQARGVQRMVEDGRDCGEIISQLASIRAATHSAGIFVLRHYAKRCAADALPQDAPEQHIEDLIDLMLRVS